jgi:tRNA (adenine57-N1/adenine58-N1)-methyltransferase
LRCNGSALILTMHNPHASESARNHSPFASGDVVIFYDRRRRRYSVPLSTGGSYSSHLGAINHDDIIGRTEGFIAVTSKGHRVTALRPTFQESIFNLPRQSQVIYPKDLGALLIRLDLYPGANVVEGGLGSGAASAAILRAIGPTGLLTTYEVRGEIIEKSQANISQLTPESTNHKIVLADIYESGIAERGIDRILFDLPEPWRAVEHAATALRTGGIIAVFLPTVLQVHKLSLAFTSDPRWRLIETTEMIERPWHVTEMSVRPEHRMVAHTGFITTARRCELFGDNEPEADETHQALQLDADIEPSAE